LFNNYGRWKDKAKAILRREKLWKYTQPPSKDGDGKVVPPADPEREKELLEDAADLLTLIISDSILDRLTKEEKVEGRKLWARLETMLQQGGLRRYIGLQRQHNALRHNPDKETLSEFLIKEKKLRDDMRATGVIVTEDIRQLIFLMSAMPEKFATVLQIMDSLKDEELTSDKAVSILQNEEIRQKQEKELAGGSKDIEKSKDLALKTSDYQHKNGNGGRKGKNPKNKGLNCGFYNIKDSHKEEDYWKKHPNKRPKKNKDQKETSTPSLLTT
jgi:hypothetical protein